MKEKKKEKENEDFKLYILIFGRQKRSMKNSKEKSLKVIITNQWIQQSSATIDDQVLKMMVIAG